MSDPDVTQLLQRMQRGDSAAAEAAAGVLYQELHMLARNLLNGRGSVTLQPTALVHEAWLRLVPGTSGSDWNDRGHFLAVASKAMRSVLVDAARRRNAQKRGGGAQRVELEDLVAAYERNAGDLLALDEALAKLAQRDEELVRIVELRFFAGASVEDTARTLGVSESTVVRGTQVARAWLAAELGS